MRTLPWTLSCVLLIAACDSEVDPAVDAGGTAGSGGASGTGEAGMSGTGGGSGSGATGGVGGASGAGATGGTAGTSGGGGSEASVVVEDVDGLRVVTFTTSLFVIAPFEERFICQNFANPLGQDVAIVKSRSSMAAGSHHMFAFQQAVSETGIGELADCNGLEFGSSAHSAQVPERTLEYPEGIARAWQGSQGIRIQAHYFNTTAEPIEGRVIVELHTSTADNFTLSSGIFFNNVAINVPPNSTGSAERTCTIPHDIELMNTISHMHQYGTRFIATTDDGTVLYETNDWAEPETREFDPPLRLPAGTEITYRCEYNNTSDTRLTFGESARSNEMCIFGGQFFPSTGGGITCN